LNEKQSACTIDSLSHDGRGITTLNGKTSFIYGALPQEEVLCQLTKRHSRYNEGEVLEILKPAKNRVTPACAHFSLCGGCSMQHMDDNHQVRFKEQMLLEQLHHFGKVTPESILPPLMGKTWHYRRKARLGVRYVRKKERVLVGFREKSTNYLTDIESCAVLHASVGLKISALQELIRSLSQFEQIPQIEVAVGDTETALIFRHMTDLPQSDLDKLQAFAQSHQLHIYLQPNSPKPLSKLWPLNSSEFLHYSLKMPRKELTMTFHPLDFIQVNGEINQALIHQALELLDVQTSDDVLDLFCGLGNFTLPIALQAKQVIGVEGSDLMVQRATMNALHNNIDNASFYSANLMEPSATTDWMNKKYDKILLDPPRTGAKEIIAHFKKFSAQKICYVSCNPATLARDAGELVHTHHYKLKKVGVVNMFPHTAHIEAIALFEK